MGKAFKVISPFMWKNSYSAEELACGPTIHYSC